MNCLFFPWVIGTTELLQKFRIHIHFYHHCWVCLSLILSLSASFVYFNMIFIYSVAANTQNTYIWLKLYHLWSSYVWDVSGKLECNTSLFCCGCRWEFLFDEQLIFSRCYRITALQGRIGVLQMWVLGVLQIHSPDSRQLSLRFFPPIF